MSEGALPRRTGAVIRCGGGRPEVSVAPHVQLVGEARVVGPARVVVGAFGAPVQGDAEDEGAPLIIHCSAGAGEVVAIVHQFRLGHVGCPSAGPGVPGADPVVDVLTAVLARAGGKAGTGTSRSWVARGPRLEQDRFRGPIQEVCERYSWRRDAMTWAASSGLLRSSVRHPR